MGKGSLKALVMWTRESKFTIEPISSVPRSSRFEGAVAPVRFSGDRKFYPARVIMISADEAVLNRKADECAAELEDKENRPQSNSKTKSRSRKSKSQPGQASERDVAQALGERLPVPAAFASAKKSTALLNQEAGRNRAQGQKALDENILVNVRRSLFSGLNSEQDESECDSSDSESDPHCRSVALQSPEDVTPRANSAVLGDDACDDTESGLGAWCSCSVCVTLSNFCDPKCVSFLQELMNLMQSRGVTTERKVLPLLPIDDHIKKVLLSSSSQSDVWISSTDRDIIKLDYKNKPTSLIRETLFHLYGKDAFRTYQVTGRGTKPGTYGLEDRVLKAVYCFVNHNVDTAKRMTMQQLVQTINKRAREWRQGLSGTPPAHKKKKLVQVESSASSSKLSSDSEAVFMCATPPPTPHQTLRPEFASTPSATPSTTSSNTPCARWDTPHPPPAPTAAPAVATTTAAPGAATTTAAPGAATTTAAPGAATTTAAPAVAPTTAAPAVAPTTTASGAATTTAAPAAAPGAAPAGTFATNPNLYYHGPGPSSSYWRDQWLYQYPPHNGYSGGLEGYNWN